MKQNLQSGLWHRCGVCGTIFMSIQELTHHMATHKTKRFIQRRRPIAPRENVTITPSVPTENPPDYTNDRV